MKKRIVWLVMACMLFCVSALAEVGTELIVNEDLLAFENELTGEVVRIGMTAEEIGEIAGNGYYTRAKGSYLHGRVFAYEGGLLVSYGKNSDGEMVAVGMAVIPMLLGSDAYDFAMDESFEVNRAYSSDDYMDAVQNSTGLVLEQAEMDRAEIEAITGPALREYYIDDEFPFILEEQVEYAQAGMLNPENNYKSMQSAAGEPGSLLMVDYDGISVLYSIQDDGEVRSGIFTSGHWYRMVAGFDMGDSASEIEALLGEYAIRADEAYVKENDRDQLRAYLYLGDDGLQLITEEEKDRLYEADEGKNIYDLYFRVGEYWGDVTYVLVQRFV